MINFTATSTNGKRWDLLERPFKEDQQPQSLSEWRTHARKRGQMYEGMCLSPSEAARLRSSSSQASQFKLPLLALNTQTASKTFSASVKRAMERRFLSK